MALRPALILAFVLAGLTARAQPAPDRMWLEMTARGPELRVVTVADHCPDAALDGAAAPMQLRAAPSEAFPQTVCTLIVPDGVSTASIGAWTAPLHRSPPQRILIFGDTGCRLKGAAVQDCNDARRWPFALVAARAAARKPDLVIHVGDYYYRESPCPAAEQGCAGSPHGDNWAAWDADFFAPSEPLLKGAPWVFARGNHESCKRGGLGWFRLLDQAPEPLTCPAESAPFQIDLGGVSLYVLDGADADDRSPTDEQVAAFSRQLDAVKPPPGESAWIVTHRPVWGLVPATRLGPLGAVEVAINAAEQAAVHGRDLARVQMIVSGHIHHFASFDFGPGRPAQLIAGTGGDVGEKADSRKPRAGVVTVDGLEAKRLTFAQYGYLLLERDGADWTGAFRDLDDRLVATCRLHARSLTCRKAGRGKG